MMRHILQNRLFLKNKKLNEAEFQAGKFILKSKPVWMQIEPTTLCNLHCLMCRDEIANKKWGKMGDLLLFQHIYDSGWLKYLELLELNGWGETFLHPQIVTFLEKCSKFKNLKIQITTNGLLIHHRNLLDSLCRLPRLNLIFSIDSADSIHYEKIRRGGSWATLTNNINALNRMIVRTKSNATKQCDCLVNALNVDRLERMVEFALEYEFDLLNFSRVHDCPDLEVPDSIALSAMENVKEYADMRNVRCRTYKKYKTRKEISEKNIEEKIWRCDRPWKHLMIRLDGNVVPCCYLSNYEYNARMGNMTEMRLSDIWNSKKYLRLRKSAFSGYPKFCDVGMAGCKAKNMFIPNVTSNVA